MVKVRNGEDTERGDTFDTGSLTDNINAAKMRGVVVTADNGFVSVSGLNDGEQVLFYATDGKVNGTASLSTSESVVICKVGTTSLKVLVK